MHNCLNILNPILQRKQPTEEQQDGYIAQCYLVGVTLSRVGTVQPTSCPKPMKALGLAPPRQVREALSVQSVCSRPIFKLSILCGPQVMLEISSRPWAEKALPPLPCTSVWTSVATWKLLTLPRAFLFPVS